MTNSALLVMDVVQGIVDRYVRDAEYLPGLRRAVDAARASDVPVIYVRAAFRDGHPEISSRNKIFAPFASTSAYLETDVSTQIHSEVCSQPGDIVITKRRVSAFTGTDLDVVLRSANIDTLVLCGIATSGVVLSTLRHAADLDYRLVVLADGCLDADPEVHSVLVGKVFPSQADIRTIGAWTEHQGRSRPLDQRRQSNSA